MNPVSTRTLPSRALSCERSSESVFARVFAAGPSPPRSCRVLRETFRHGTCTAWPRSVFAVASTGCLAHECPKLASSEFRQAVAAVRWWTGLAGDDGRPARRRSTSRARPCRTTVPPLSLAKRPCAPHPTPPSLSDDYAQALGGTAREPCRANNGFRTRPSRAEALEGGVGKRRLFPCLSATVAATPGASIWNMMCVINAPHSRASCLPVESLGGWTL
jgi:hypothetical protein